MRFEKMESVMRSEGEHEEARESLREAAGKLFDRWAEEEAGGYAGEISWEELKRDLDDERRRSGARLLFPEG